MGPWGGRKRSAHNLPGYVNRELFKLIKLFIVLAMMHVIVHKETFHTLTCWNWIRVLVLWSGSFFFSYFYCYWVFFFFFLKAFEFESSWEYPHCDGVVPDGNKIKFSYISTECSAISQIAHHDGSIFSLRGFRNFLIHARHGHVMSCRTVHLCWRIKRVAWIR